MKYLLLRNYNKDVVEFLQNLNPPATFVEEDGVLIMGFNDLFDFNYEDICLSLIIDLAVNFSALLTPEIKKEDVLLFKRVLLKSDKKFITMFDLVINYHLKLKRILFSPFKQKDEIINLIKEVFNCDLNLSKAAARLGIHRNTMNQKVNLIKNMTGFDLHKFYDALCLYNVICEKEE